MSLIMYKDHVEDWKEQDGVPVPSLYLHAMLYTRYGMDTNKSILLHLLLHVLGTPPLCHFSTT